jgi:hypothetical protein
MLFAELGNRCLQLHLLQNPADLLDRESPSLHVRIPVHSVRLSRELYRFREALQGHASMLSTFNNYFWAAVRSLDPTAAFSGLLYPAPKGC